MLTAVALDDEPLALNVIKALCDKVDSVALVKTFTETREALKYLQKNPVDLLFLDINMPAMSGVDFAKLLPPDILVIFTTAYSEYAVEGFNLNAVDYLLKPFEFSRFELAVNKAHEYMQYLRQKSEAAQQYLFVRAEYSLVKIALNDITYIEGLDNYLKIHLEGQKKVLVRMSMKVMMEKLPADAFFRVHRSYIIPLRRIQSIRNKIIQMGDTEIPIGSNYYEPLMAHLNL